MNFTAKNLIQLCKTNKEDILKLNCKIIEEIIERCMKFNKNN